MGVLDEIGVGLASGKKNSAGWQLRWVTRRESKNRHSPQMRWVSLEVDAELSSRLTSRLGYPGDHGGPAKRRWPELVL